MYNIVYIFFYLIVIFCIQWESVVSISISPQKRYSYNSLKNYINEGERKKKIYLFNEKNNKFLFMSYMKKKEKKKKTHTGRKENLYTHKKKKRKEYYTYNNIYKDIINNLFKRDIYSKLYNNIKYKHKIIPFNKKFIYHNKNLLFYSYIYEHFLASFASLASQEKKKKKIIRIKKKKYNNNRKNGKIFLDTFNSNEYEEEQEELELDPELHESLGGCLENDFQDNYFDTLLGSSEIDYNCDEDKYDKDDVCEETKRKKYYVYGRKYTDKDYNSEHVNKYYKHLPIYSKDDSILSNKNFKRIYESNKMENLERNIREEDLYYPSVPIKWKLYVGIFFDKKYNYENDEDKNIYDKFNINIRHKYVLEFLSWVKLSTRIYQNTSKILMLFNLKRNQNIFGNLIFFTSLNLHYANLFMKSNPYIKLGLCEELYLYSYENNSDHFLLGTFPNLSIQKNFLLIKFFNPKKLQDINDLYEKHMRFYIRSNMIFKLGVLKKVPKDKLQDFFLSPHQYLPITNEQTSTVLKKFDEEFKMFENCASVDVNRNSEIQNVEGDKEENSTYNKKVRDDHDEKNEEDFGNDYNNDETFIKYDNSCLAELNIINCKDDEEADEFIQKDPYMRSCFYDSIFVCEAAELSPHIKYSEAYMPKLRSKVNYKYELDTDLNPTECLENKPEYLGNRRLDGKGLNNYNKVDFDILDTFIKLKYTNQEVQLEDSTYNENDKFREYNGKKEELRDSRKNEQEYTETLRNNSMIINLENNKKMDITKNDEQIGKSYISSYNNIFGNRKNKYVLKSDNNGGKNYRIKIVDYDNDYMDYLCNVQENKILYVKNEYKINILHNNRNKEKYENNDNIENNSYHHIYDTLNEDKKNPFINKEKDIILIDNSLQFFDHIFFKDYLSDYVYISLPPGEYIEDPYTIKDEKNYEFTRFNNSLASQDDFLKRQNYLPSFLKGIWLKKDHSKILFYDKQNNALLFGTGIDKTFSWNKKVDNKIMKRALINMEIALEKIRKGSSVIHEDDITIHNETERIQKEYTDPYTSFKKRFTSVHNHLQTSDGYKDMKPPPGLEYLNPLIWDKTPDEHKKLILDTDKVQEIHSKFLKKLELYKVSIDDDPFIQKVPSESDLLNHSDKVNIEIL
ncbi:conserved Plasmodium protein, unknown function [Plasmodium reichenowi]|uniref:Uncharacterized protein n=1 Tax=Plasmodium reichenowi TaxID=5854 RepID=A0A2P9DIC3_PLARE|nr:conserved Plasmodium protein, unknown function [Plasmodium reichenowi]